MLDVFRRAIDQVANTGVISIPVEIREVQMRIILAMLYLAAMYGCAAGPQSDWLQGVWVSDSDSTIRMNVQHGVFPAHTTLDDPVAEVFKHGKIVVEGRSITETDVATRSGRYKILEETVDSVTLAITWPPKASYRFIKRRNGFCMSWIPAPGETIPGMMEGAWSCFVKFQGGPSV